jgi:hypothetical protein
MSKVMAKRVTRQPKLHLHTSVFFPKASQNQLGWQSAVS